MLQASFAEIGFGEADLAQAIKPDVTQVRLFGGQCSCCGQRVTAEAPPGLEPGWSFGRSVCALVVYL